MLKTRVVWGVGDLSITYICTFLKPAFRPVIGT